MRSPSEALEYIGGGELAKKSRVLVALEEEGPGFSSTRYNTTYSTSSRGSSVPF